MNWIAGIWNVDGHPIDPDQLDRLGAPVKEHAPDGCHSWVDRHIGMICCKCNTIRVPLNEASAGSAEERKTRVCFDGRLDNRDELLAQIGSNHLNCRHATDSEVVAALYEARGTQCIKEIVGDFAL